jgi:hypothetical protein
VHLHEAEQRIRALAGESFDSLVRKMQAAYDRLTPRRDLILSRVEHSLRRHFWPRFLARLLRLIIFGLILLAVAWAIQRWWPQIVDFTRGVLNPQRVE